MVIDIKKEELVIFYLKAKQKYSECIRNFDNKFLENEVPIPIEKISVKFSNIKVILNQDIIENYLFEITLDLVTIANENIGKYVYIEDKYGNSIDDSLVLF